MQVSRFRLFDNSELDVLATALFNLKGQGKVTRIQELELDFLAEEVAVEKERRARDHRLPEYVEGLRLPASFGRDAANSGRRG